MTDGSVISSFEDVPRERLASMAEIRKWVWPLKDSEATLLLRSFVVFLVPPAKEYKWHRFPCNPTADLLVVSREGERPEFVIVDGKIGSSNVYRRTVNLKQVLAACKPTKGICAGLKRLSFEERTFMAILKASVDDVASGRLLNTEARIMTKRLTIIPHPLCLLEECLGKRVDGNVFKKGDSWELQVDVCDALNIWPVEIGRRELILKRGIAFVPAAFFLRTMTSILFRYLRRLASAARLKEWIESSETSAEKDFVVELTQRNEKRKRRVSDSVISDAAPPACIKQLCSKAKTQPWKNDDRYQLAYVLNTLAQKRDVDGVTIAEPFVEIMRQYNMGEDRIKAFQSQIRPHYIDKRTCKSRARLASGLVCPYGVGGVKACINSRKGIYLDAESVGIADVWAFSAAE